MTTEEGLYIHLTDFSDEHGDQKTLSIMKSWARNKMGKSLDELVSSKKTRIDTLTNFSTIVAKMGKRKGLSPDYLSAISDIHLEIIKEIIKES